MAQWMSQICTTCLVVAVVLPYACCQHGSIGYSYNSFSGPVSGSVQEISVARSHGPSVDYVAKPDYSFAYGVEDPLTRNSQRHKESREGDVVRGEYSVLEADGSVRTVTYTADPKNGFQATVQRTQPPTSAPPPPPPQQHLNSPDYYYY